MTIKNIDEFTFNISKILQVEEGKWPDAHCCSECFQAGMEASLRGLELVGIDHALLEKRAQEKVDDNMG